SRVAVGPEPQMDEVERGRPFGQHLESTGVLLRRRLRVGGFYGHGVDLVRRERHASEQALAPVREVAVVISPPGEPLVDLRYVHTAPRDILPGEVAQHDPGRLAAADREDKRAAENRGRANLIGDELRRASSDLVGVSEYLYLHTGAPLCFR